LHTFSRILRNVGILYLFDSKELLLTEASFRGALVACYGSRYPNIKLVSTGTVFYKRMLFNLSVENIRWQIWSLDTFLSFNIWPKPPWRLTCRSKRLVNQMRYIEDFPYHHGLWQNRCYTLALNILELHNEKCTRKLKDASRQNRRGFWILRLELYTRKLTAKLENAPRACTGHMAENANDHSHIDVATRKKILCFHCPGNSVHLLLL